MLLYNITKNILYLHIKYSIATPLYLIDVLLFFHYYCCAQDTL